MQYQQIYYVYMYLDRNGAPFYIGKGKKTRYQVIYHISRTVANKLLKNKILKIGKENITIKFLHTNLTEEQAFYLEEYYIAGIGRRDKGLGPLCNLTNGGEGNSGLVMSEDARKKMSKARIGKKLSVETRNKLSKILKGQIITEKTKLLISTAHKGIKHTEDARAKMSKTRVNNKNALGHKLSDVHKQMIGDRYRGKCLSEEIKQKMSESQKRRWQVRKGALCAVSAK